MKLVSDEMRQLMLRLYKEVDARGYSSANVYIGEGRVVLSCYDEDGAYVTSIVHVLDEGDEDGDSH